MLSSQFTFLRNSPRDYAVSALTIAVGFVLIRLFKVLVMARFKKWASASPSPWDDVLAKALERNAIPALYVAMVYLGLRDLDWQPSLRIGLRALAAVLLGVLGVRVILAFARYGVKSHWLGSPGERNAAQERNINGIFTLVQFVVWMLAFVLVLDNLGIKVSAFMTGLGITGIAVALAAQAVLADLFSYFVILFDQPFEIGHVIKVDGFTGEVERIGIKTTRLRGIDGEQIVFSNKFITDSRVQNFKRMSRRRAVFVFEVDYATPDAALRAVPSMVEALAVGVPDVSFERAHFKDFGPAGLRFEAVYFVETQDFNRYMDVQQGFNLGLKEKFREAGIEFALPLRTVNLRPDGPKA